MLRTPPDQSRKDWLLRRRTGLRDTVNAKAEVPTMKAAALQHWAMPRL
jgi:hypothetical protein